MFKGILRSILFFRREWLCVLLQLDRNLSDNFLRQLMTSRFLRAVCSERQLTALGDVSFQRRTLSVSDAADLTVSLEAASLCHYSVC